MAKLILDGPDLVVGLSPLEKLGALRDDVRVPLSAVRESPFARLVVTVADPDRTVAAIRSATGI